MSRELTENHKGPWSPEEFARHMRVCRATVYNWMSRGWLKSIKIGGARRIMPEHKSALISRFGNEP